MVTAEELLEFIKRYSRKYIDGRVIYWELEAAARKKFGLDHNEYCDLIEKLVEEGKVGAEFSKDGVDVYFKPKERDGRDL